jgi:hypothetical protein
VSGLSETLSMLCLESLMLGKSGFHHGLASSQPAIRPQ